MEWVVAEFLQNEDYLDAQSEATDLLQKYYMGAARNEAGELGIGIIDISHGEPDPPIVQFVPTSETDFPRMTRVYTEVYGYLEEKVRFDNLTPRGQAIVACKKWPGGLAIELATKAGIENVFEVMETPDGWGNLEVRLRQITYTRLVFSINGPVDPERLVPGFIKDTLNKLGLPVYGVKIK